MGSHSFFAIHSPCVGYNRKWAYTCDTISQPEQWPSENQQQFEAFRTNTHTHTHTRARVRWLMPTTTRRWKTMVRLAQRLFCHCTLFRINDIWICRRAAMGPIKSDVLPAREWCFFPWWGHGIIVGLKTEIFAFSFPVGFISPRAFQMQRERLFN